MKYQSLPKNISSTSKQSMKDSSQPPWYNLIRPVDDPMPEHSFHCQCAMCNLYEYRKLRETLKQQTGEISAKIQTRVTTSNAVRLQKIQSNYHWIIKHLMMPHHKIATSTLPIHITESLFFKDGEAYQLFLIKEIEDPTFKRIPKDKLNNAHVQKIMSDRRRKYKDFIRTKTGRKKAEQKKKLLFGQKQVKKQIKDAVLIRYLDGFEQLLTENQFLSMSLRRKQDPIWRQVMSIRNFINITNPQQKSSSYVVSKFKRDKIEDKNLFQRARVLMKVYGEYIREGDQQYISPTNELQFRKELQAASLKRYSDYLVYQMVNYIEYFYDEYIKTVVIGFYYDELSHAFLNQVYKLDIKSLIKFAWTNDIYRKRMDDEETKILNSKEVASDSTLEKAAEGIIGAMHSAYEKMRDRMGLNAEDEDNKEQVANNNFFKILHPQFHHNVTDVLKDPNLTVSEFKKSYLGFKQKKKPVIKQFTSNMIKTIHLTSPRFQTSNPHDFIDNNSKYASPRFPQSERKKSGVLSPLKLESRRKLYQTLPLRDMK